MKLLASRRDVVALVASVVAPLAVTAVLVPFRTKFSNTDAALVLVAVIVAVAANGDRLAGYVSGVSSAIWYDFFLTQPYERLTITRSKDIATTVLLLVIGIAVTELSAWGRRQSAASSRRAGYVSGIYAAAELATHGQTKDQMIDHVTNELCHLLNLSMCRFEVGVSGVNTLARLHHDGTVTTSGQRWPVDERGLPTQGNIELVIETGGYLRGRFLMRAAGGRHPSLEDRLVAAALADQVGVAPAG